MKPPRSDGDDDLDESVRAVTPAPSADPGQSSGARNRRLGTVLRGKYRLENVIGIGGMSVVYRAIHRNQAEYAIKMLLPEHAANGDLRSRFLREGYAANSVKHPGAVRVVDDDVAEDGSAFLVLELLHGVSCEKLCQAHGGRLPIEAACAIGLQALDVLRSAHLNGIIHRDIKPSNLFLLRSGEIKVLDFGIARVRETLVTGSHTTGSGDVLLGTPAFMAPEQAMGRPSDVDTRADIWAVGATLFALMSGVTVHEGDSGRELLVKLVTRPTRSLLEVMPELPTALAEVIDRALEVDRENRWPSAAAMRDELEVASRDLWKERSPRVVLAALVATIPDPDPTSETTQNPESQKRSPVIAAPTLRAQEHPSPRASLPKPTGETAQALSHEQEKSAPRPARRLSLLVILAVLGLGAGIAVIAAVTARGRDGSAQPSSSTAGGAAVPSIEVSSPPIASEAVSPLDAVPPPAETAVAPPDGGRLGRARGAPKQNRDVPVASAVPLPTAHPPSSPVPVSPTASERPASPPKCNPPFYFDSKMNRVFKKECL
ncbi:MAG TPA: protein kinase [Polyangiaceae bacterium]